MKPQQSKFVAEYLKNGCKDATKAAIAAGYSPDTARTQAYRLLKKDYIQAEVNKYLDKQKDKALVTLDEIVADLKEVKDRCLQHKPVMEFDKVNQEWVQKKALVQDEETGELKEVGIYEFDANGANKAIELLGKTIKAFTDKIEVKDTTDRAAALAKARKRIGKADDEKPAGN